MIKKFLCILFVLCSALMMGQEAGAEMADGMRESGKIWVVIGVIVIIFVAIVGFLMLIEMKLKKLEEKTKQKQ
jgi:hypothetical protein